MGIIESISENILSSFKKTNESLVDLSSKNNQMYRLDPKRK